MQIFLFCLCFVPAEPIIPAIEEEQPEFTEPVEPGIIEQSSFEHHVMDFDGEVYLLRHSRGYGVSYYGDAEIIEQTDSKMLARVKMCRIVNEEVGIAEVEFEKIDEKWIIVSVEDSYY